MLKSYFLAAMFMFSFAVSDSTIASDCAQGSTKIEKLICGSDGNGLKWLDEVLNSEYKRAIARAADPGVF